MWMIYSQSRPYLGKRHVVKTENEYQAKQVTNALNKMAIGRFIYEEMK